MKQYDCIIIGSGQAGTPLAKKLAEAGKKTLLIEKRFIGGTCVNDGCTPTKAMIGSARLAYLAGKPNDMGVTVEAYKIDLRQINKRKNDIVHQWRNGGQTGLEKSPNLDLLFGEATFTGIKTISVKPNDGGNIQEFKADLIFIDTGAKTIVPDDIEGVDNIDYLTSTSILDLVEVPEHLLIIGGSYIGLEFGQMFRRFGSRVTILERQPRLLSGEDEDVARELTNILEKEDIKIHTGTRITKFQKVAGDKITATVIMNGREENINCSHVLIAVGRAPQTGMLALDKTGVKTDERGQIIVDSRLETSQEGIYALGDVKGGPAFTHISYNDYIIVYGNLIENQKLDIKDRLVPYCMFTDPELGRVGISETEARRQGLNYKVTRLPMTSVARAIETGDTRGFMKAVVDPETKKILGVAVIGIGGGEIMSVLQMAMEGGITYDRIRNFVFAHPTYSESLNNLFMALKD
jgi:pyruvate/2-oxoglutarate dehydrogenase complex dihydrolipoamide dehydrogenase (E3) component